MTTQRITLRDRGTGDVVPVYEQHGTVQFVAGVAYVDDVADAAFLDALAADEALGAYHRTWRARADIEAAERPEGWPPPVARTTVGRPLGLRERPEWVGGPLQDAASPSADPDQLLER